MGFRQSGRHQMTIKCGDWRIAPYGGGGMRCWQVFHGKGNRAMRYYSDLGSALQFCAEYDLRNKVEGEYDLAGALEEYREIAESLRAAASA